MNIHCILSSDVNISQKIHKFNHRKRFCKSFFINSTRVTISSAERFTQKRYRKFRISCLLKLKQVCPNTYYIIRGVFVFIHWQIIPSKIQLRTNNLLHVSVVQSVECYTQTKLIWHLEHTIAISHIAFVYYRKNRLLQQ